jgi:hypothetical protein
MRVLLLCAAASSVLACTGEGSFDLELVLPTDPTLRPTGMTTVTVVMTSGDNPPVSTTSVLEGSVFTAGDVAVADDVRIEVQLRDVSNRLVGVGETADPIDIVAGESTSVSIAVRRPFVYASNGSALFSFDPTLDATDGMFQGQLMGVTGPRVVVSVGGDRLAIVSATQINVVATDTNKPVGSPITLTGMTRDATYVPGTRSVAVASDQGITLVNIDTGDKTATTIAGGVDRVTVGPTSDGRFLVHGLIGRVEPAVNPLKTCTGTSSIVSYDVAAPPVSAMPKALPEAVSDLAAAPENVGVFATLPCTGKVVKIQGELDTGNPTFADFATLPRAAALAVAGGRVIAAGTEESDPQCSPSCQPDSSTACSGPQPASKVNFVRAGAHLIVLSIPIAGGMPIKIDLPDRRETILDMGDPADSHAQVLHSFGIVPVDLVALPGGQHVGIVTTSNYYIEELQDQGTGLIILPCLNATTADWLLVDLATTSIASRVRTSCSLEVGNADLFPDWKCDLPPPGEQSAFGEYTPVSVGALFGAR